MHATAANQELKSANREFESARRINRSLTAAKEKRALEWMAARVPRWVSSDQLTLLGATRWRVTIAARCCW
jgi:hypothetical protein